MLYIEKIDVRKVPLSEMQNFVCKARLEYAKNFPSADGALGIACEFLLNKILCAHKAEFGLNDSDFPLEVEHTKDGKAVFSKCYSQKMPYFSFSHSFDFACCAVSDKMVGIDIEKMRAGATKIAARYFCPTEVAWIFSESRGDPATSDQVLSDFARDPVNTTGRGDLLYATVYGDPVPSDSVERFFAMWTLKESFLKASGKAGKISMKDFRVKCDIEQKKAIYCHNVDNEKYMGKLLQAPLGYAMAVCLQEKGDKVSFKVFIDGQEGTTGLKILERFKNRSDISILCIENDLRKDVNRRKELINESDYTFLCLPDAAAIEAVSLCENPNTVIIDASTAHRTNPDWAYGFPELSSEHRAKIQNGKRIAVPGCYASGFASIVYPLVQAGILPKDYPVTCHAVSGYSGGGKKAIATYEASERSAELKSPRLYALTQVHKHLPEMQKISGLDYKPIFNPYICDYFNGMAVSVPLHMRLLNVKNAQEIVDAYKKHYENSVFVKVADLLGSDILSEPYIASNTLADTNNMQIFVCADENNERVTITSRFDNLGKGASGAAVQCMNISMGIDETTALV